MQTNVDYRQRKTSKFLTMENTSTDAWKASELESKLLSGQRKEFFELGFMAGVKFAKSIHSTLYKVDVSQIIEDVKSLRLEYPGVLTVREAAANEAIDKTLKIIESWRESLSEQPEAKPTKSEQVENLKEALSNMIHVAGLDEWELATTGRQLILKKAKETLNSLKQ